MDSLVNQKLAENAKMSSNHFEISQKLDFLELF